MDTPAAQPARNYHELQPELIVRTAEQLERRVRERFGDCGLANVCGELAVAIRNVREVSAYLARPNYTLRTLVGLMVVLLGVAVFALGDQFVVNLQGGFEDWSELLQGLEAGVNDLVFIAIGIWFLVGLEARRKRTRALRSLHALRSLAHIVDMHQLTKDPEALLMEPEQATPSSPRRTMTPFELLRYLDYCSEALALISKAAALHLRRFDDRETLAAVGDIEDLSDGLSRKIWQKITILDRFLVRSGASRNS